MLDQVYSNLIENSILQEEPYRSRHHLPDQDGGLVIYVEDDGVGIPEAEEKIFEYC